MLERQDIEYKSSRHENYLKFLSMRKAEKSILIETILVRSYNDNIRHY